MKPVWYCRDGECTVSADLHHFLSPTNCCPITAILASASAFFLRSFSTTAAGGPCTKRSLENFMVCFKNFVYFCSKYENNGYCKNWHRTAIVRLLFQGGTDGVDLFLCFVIGDAKHSFGHVGWGRAEGTESSCCRDGKWPFGSYTPWRSLRESNVKDASVWKSFGMN